MVEIAQLLARTMVPVAAAVPLLSAQMAQAQPAVMVATVQPRQFLDRLLLMRAAAVAQPTKAALRVVVAQAAAATPEQLAATIPVLLARQIREAVVAGRITNQAMPLAVQAAPASSSSNTTSALPRSSPSSPRRSGLHRLVRSALTTSL